MDEALKQRLEALEAELAGLRIGDQSQISDALAADMAGLGIGGQSQILSTSSLANAILAAYTASPSSVTVEILTRESLTDQNPSWTWAEWLILPYFTPWRWNRTGTKDIKKGDFEVMCCTDDALVHFSFVDLALHREHRGRSVLAAVVKPDFSKFDDARLHVLAWRLHGLESQHKDR
jgi:hypothetical protein